eukprot:scaffold36164_cov33-Tisochrysis_lutea.AAC.2
MAPRSQSHRASAASLDTAASRTRRSCDCTSESNRERIAARILSVNPTKPSWLGSGSLGEDASKLLPAGATAKLFNLLLGAQRTFVVWWHVKLLALTQGKERIGCVNEKVAQLFEHKATLGAAVPTRRAGKCLLVPEDRPSLLPNLRADRLFEWGIGLACRGLASRGWPSIELCVCPWRTETPEYGLGVADGSYSRWAAVARSTCSSWTCKALIDMARRPPNPRCRVWRRRREVWPAAETSTRRNGPPRLFTPTQK